MVVDSIFNMDHAPGTILKDMASFLCYIEENQLEITGNKGLLPNHCLPKINAGMTHPLKLVLKREQQISYPHISALYLLSRSLGLIQIIQNKSKRFLTVDTEMIIKWNKFNEIEQYFGLMQMWFFHCDERLILRGRHNKFRGPFDSAYQFVKDNVKKPLEIRSKEEHRWVVYHPNLYNLALLEMFGLVNIKDNEESFEKSWTISSISVSDFGKRWVQLLEKTNYKELILQLLLDEDGSAGVMEAFHQKLAPYFPQWKACIELKKKTTDLGLHFFNVSLSKKIWRKISIQGSQSLDDLASLVLDAFDFDNDHLSQFTYTDRSGALKTINDCRAEAPPYSHEVNVGDIDILPGDCVEFLFDFGDSWLFQIQLEKIDHHFKDGKSMVIESFGESPKQYFSCEN